MIKHIILITFLCLPQSYQDRGYVKRAPGFGDSVWLPITSEKYFKYEICSQVGDHQWPVVRYSESLSGSLRQEAGYLYGARQGKLGRFVLAKKGDEINVAGFIYYVGEQGVISTRWLLRVQEDLVPPNN